MPTLGRRSYLVTYSANGFFMDFNMFKVDPYLESIDELHYTNDAAVVYVYIHFQKAVLPRDMTTFLDKLKRERNMVLFDILGYESMASTKDGDLTEHIAFKVLMDHYTSGHPSFKACTNGVSGVTKGLFHQYNFPVRIKEELGKRNKLLVDYVCKLESDSKEYKKQTETVELMREQILLYEERHLENKRYKLICDALRSRMQYIDESVQAFLLRPILDSNRQHQPLFGDERDNVGYQSNIFSNLQRPNGN